MNGDLKTLRLAAMDLWDRYGFSRGDPFDFEDRGPSYDGEPSVEWMQMYEAMDREMRIDVLEALICNHLLPAIAAADGESPKIERFETPHNPIRDARYDMFLHPDPEPPEWRGIFVDVAPEEIMIVVGQVRTRYERTAS